jgi:hypothetical protein
MLNLRDQGVLKALFYKYGHKWWPIAKMLPHFVSEICLCDKINRRIQQLDVEIFWLRGVLQGFTSNLMVCQLVRAGLDLNTINSNSVSVGVP